MNFRITILAVVALLCSMRVTAGAPSVAYALPTKVADVRTPVVSLSGTWDFQFASTEKWDKIVVPGEVAMQGFAIEHNKPVLYKKSFTVPSDFSGKRTILRFDGVYSHAKLWVNGTFVREHHGGFTRWETDVTKLVKTGRRNEIRLEVTDRLDDISYASGYAHHPIGGILRDVTLFALPTDHIAQVAIQTDLDSVYRNANLTFDCNFSGTTNNQIAFTLTDPQGARVALSNNTFTLKQGANNFTLPVVNPAKWDAEHPRLYTLEVKLLHDGKEQSTMSRKVGFRKIEVLGNQMLLNGMAVKLRGACRHDLHPTLGRTTTAEIDSLDAVMFKRANMNFVRTSHYPPTERFLEFCDRYGIYVESETAVCFVNTHRQKNYAPASSQNDSTFADRYLSQCIEMVNSLRNHASVVLWSIGNESTYGTNFQRCWNWVKATDTTRPVIFSYPGTTPKDNKIYDILSMHYQDVYGNLWQYGMSTQNFQGHGIPALFDEWAHPACYTYATLQNDPNIREFWGKSLDMMWSGLFAAQGGLGGAIWGYVDETFALPEPKVGKAWWKEFAHTAKPEGFRGNCVGYGQWGIVDIWRREKPEFWSTKKAHSPVRVEVADNVAFTSNQRLTMPVHNRFDHTNLNEIKGFYTFRGEKKALSMPSIAPHAKGVLTIPAESWSEGEALLIEFFAANGELIDAYSPWLGAEKIVYPAPLLGSQLTVDDAGSFVTVRGDGFAIPFDKATGLITNALAGDKVIIEKGPFLNIYVNLNHLTGAEVRKTANFFVTLEADWKLGSFDWKKLTDGVHIELNGTYRGVAVDFAIRISAGGELDIDYTTSGVPNGFLREVGLGFHLSPAAQQLTWHRDGYWNYYPDGDFAGNTGTAPLYNDTKVAYGQKPDQAWGSDTHDYYYWADEGANCKQPLTQTAKGMKENIHFYTIGAADTANGSLSVISRDATVACRLNKRTDEQLVLYTNNRWDYPEIAWGNYCKTLEALPCYGHIRLQVR